MLAIIAWVLFVTAMRALRTPNDFSEAHWLIDYGAGFIRRGLVGSMMGMLSDIGLVPLTETNILIISAILFVLFCLVVLALSWRILDKSNWRIDAFLMVVAFATSPFIVVNAHLVGYFDHLVIPISLAAALLVLHNRGWLAGLLMAVAVLIHEGVLFLGFPLLVFALYLRSVRVEGNKLTLRPFLPLLLPVAAFLAVWFSENFLVNTWQVQNYLTTRMAQFDFISLNRDILVPRWLVRDPIRHLLFENHKLIGRLTDPLMLLAMIPSMITILVFVFRRFRIKLQSFEALMVFAITLFPLTMHALAWDTPRIWSRIIFSAFGIAWLYCEAVPQTRVRTAWWFWLLALFTLVVNMFIRIPLMDYWVERYTSTTRLMIYAPLLLGIAILVVYELLLRRGKFRKQPDLPQ